MIVDGLIVLLTFIILGAITVAIRETARELDAEQGIRR